MLGIKTCSDPFQQGSEDLSRVFWFAFEQQDGQSARRGEDRALRREPLEGRAGILGSRGHQRASDRGEQEKREDLLPDAFWVLGVELMVTDVIALLEPIEQFDLPSVPVEIADQRVGELSAREGGEEHLYLAVRSDTTYRAQLLRRQQMRRIARRGNEHDVGLVSARLHELFDRRKASRNRHAHDEFQVVLDEQVDHEVAGIPTVEHEYVALARAGQKVAQMCPLVRCARADQGIDGHLGQDIEQHGDRGLWYVCIPRATELTPQLGCALRRNLAAIDGQHTSPVQSMLSAMQPVELFGRVSQELPNCGSAEPLACVAEGSARDGLVDGQQHLIHLGLIPEPVKQVLVTAPSAIRGHVDQKRDQELWRQRPTSREALAALLEFACDGTFDLQRYGCEGGTKISPACFGPSSKLFLVGEKKHVAVKCDRRDVHILASGFASDQRRNYVNGIAGGVGLWRASL